MAYTGTDLSGQEGVDNLSFPGIHPDAATWLVENRDIKAVGLDTSGIDYGKSKDFKTHRILFAQGVTAYENLAYLPGRTPPRGILDYGFTYENQGRQWCAASCCGFLALMARELFFGCIY